MQNKRQPEVVIYLFHHPKNLRNQVFFTNAIIAKPNDQSQEKSGSEPKVNG